jgi:hypothetical protein
MDKVATNFLKRVLKALRILEEDTQSIEQHGFTSPGSAWTTSPEDSSSQGSTAGTSRLHDLADDLLDMLCYPFSQLRKPGDNDDFSLEPAVTETFVNGDLNFAYRGAMPFNADDDFELDDLLSCDSLCFQEDGTTGEGQNDGEEGYRQWELGGFMGVKVPYGWSS